MRPAIIKFNGGKGALLCNRCRTILKTGFNHATSKEYFCEGGCKANEEEPDHLPTCRCEVCRYWGA